MKCNLVNENFRSNYAENLLKARGVVDVHAFMEPRADYVQSPHDLKNIGMAAAMFLRIVMNDKPPYSRILIIVDSDCDGFTSATIMYQYTKKVNCHCQIDYWLHEGKQHGLQDHIDRLLNEDVHYDLIILPDSSSNDAHYHDMLDGINIPCLILDHHLTDVALSDNAVVVNNQLSPNYHNKELTGAGVVYQFCRFLDEKLQTNWADNYIDLAALGIVGDMGSVLELENRYIIYQGLHYIKNNLFHCMLEKASYSITGKMDASWSDIQDKTNPISVAFYIVPMINALIRVGTMEEKELLFQAFLDGAQMVPCNKRGAKGTLERADVEATRVCTNAKAHQNKLLDDVMLRLEAKIFKYDLLENKILFVRLDEEKFPSEINGLIAMRLAAKYKKPTIVARLNEQGYDRGSIRGVNNSPLPSFKDFLTQSGLFEYVQGHANAAGCSISDKSLTAFHVYANEALKDMDFGENCYDVNFERLATASDLKDIIIELSKMDGIWGQQNPQPMIHVQHIIVDATNIRIMGSNQDTLKIEYNGVAYMKFHAKDLIDQIKQHSTSVIMEIVGRPNLNTWMGISTPQIFIEDYELQVYNSLDF